MRMRCCSINRMVLTLAWASAIALVVLAASAEAQRPGGRGGPGGGFGFGRGGGMGGANFEIMLLNAEPVQKELELVDDQIQNIKKYSEEQQAAGRERMEKLRDLSDDERREKMQELMKDSEKKATAKLDEVLLPHQRDRLKEIGIQVRGPQAIAADDIADKLALTSEQKEQIEKLGEENREKMRELFQGGGGGGDPEANREKMQKMRKESGEKLLGVLTADQKQKYEKLQGKKIDLDMGQIFGRGPGGPGGPGGGRRRGGGNQN